MPDLDLIIMDKALRHAVAEQLKTVGGWHVTEIESVAAWTSGFTAHKSSALFFDESSLMPEIPLILADVQKNAPHTQIFVIGESRDDLQPYVTEFFPKPVRLGHVLARLQFYNQVQQQAKHIELAFGLYRLLPRLRQAIRRIDDEIIPLTDKEAILLDYLYQSPDPVHRDDLLATLWGYADGLDTHTLETHIYRLRRKLCVAGKPDIFLVEQSCYRIHPEWLKTW